MEQLSITHVDKFKGFLVIYGHKKPELLQHLQALIDAFKPNHASCEQSMSHIEFDTMYLAYNSKLRKYHRCFVIEKRPNNKVVIDLMDYGTEYEVAAECVRVYGFFRHDFILYNIGYYFHIFYFSAQCDVYSYLNWIRPIEKRPYYSKRHPLLPNTFWRDFFVHGKVASSSL